MLRSLVGSEMCIRDSFPGLSMTFAVCHDFPGLENGPPKFHDFPGPEGTLYRSPVPTPLQQSWGYYANKSEPIVWSSMPNVTLFGALCHTKGERKPKFDHIFKFNIL